MGAKALGADVVLALDSAKIGVMSAKRAVAFLLNDKITEDVSRSDLEAKWDSKIGTPVAAASAGEVDDIIDGSEARVRIAGALMMLSAKSKCAPSRRHTNMPL
jgi:acetyl-CoA carboxylase carboxyltransferase component